MVSRLNYRIDQISKSDQNRTEERQWVKERNKSDYYKIVLNVHVYAQFRFSRINI